MSKIVWKQPKPPKFDTQSAALQNGDKDHVMTAYAVRKQSMRQVENESMKSRRSFKEFIPAIMEHVKVQKLTPEDLKYYKDRFCEILGSQLILEGYWWPFWWSFREFDLSLVTAVWWDNVDEMIGCSWGLNCCDCIYWALHCCRECSQSERKYNIVIQYGDERSLKGFTVEDIDRFLAVISQTLKPSVPIIRGCPTEFERQTIQKTSFAKPQPYRTGRVR